MISKYRKIILNNCNKEIIALYKTGLSLREIAKIKKISRQTACNAVKELPKC